MVKTNIQTFTGEVEILSNLHVGPSGSSYLTANGAASNVLDITGNVGATFFVGDGGFLSNIATTLSDIVNQGNTVSNVVKFSSASGYSGTGIITDSNVGIQNTAPTHTLSIGDKIRIDNNTNESAGESVMQVDGRILATRFKGDGGLLSNIATTFESIVNQGNVSANVVKFSSASGYGGAGVITDSNVGIQNTSPTHNLSIGSNVHVNDTGANVLTVHGNVVASNINMGVFSIVPAYGLNDVCSTSNGTTNVVQFQNGTTSLVASSNITAAGNITAQTLISTANVEITDRLKFDGNVFVDTLRVADVAANIVTYDRTTGELLDSSGTFMNKFAVVSEQPPSDIFSNTITVANHGTYTLTTSNLATNSNTFNAFDGTANAWVSGNLESSYYGGDNVFHENNLTQLSNLHPTQRGDWLAIEFPYKTTLRHMKLTPLTREQFPEKANLYATNNDLTWTEIGYWKDRDPVTNSNVQTITVDATEQFKKYALVATQTVAASNVAIQDWQLFTESFSIDGGKVAMAQQAVTGGETVVDQSGPHERDGTESKEYPEIAFEDGEFEFNDSTNTYIQAGYTVTSSSQEIGLLNSKDLRGSQGYELLTGAQDLTNADGSYGIKGMQATAAGANTPRGRNAEIPSGSNPKSSGALTPTGTRYFWADLGDDICDEWGMWYIYNPADQTASHIQFGFLNGPNEFVYSETQTHHGKTFTIKHGWLVQGIFKLDVECSDADFQFTIGMYGNLGSDSTTTNEDKRYNASWGPLNYNFNRTNSGNALNTDPFYTYLIPKLKSYNDAITLSGTNFTAGVTTTIQDTDHLAIWFDTLKVGATMYFVKGASGNITTSHMNTWIENDIAHKHASWNAFDNITTKKNTRPESSEQLGSRDFSGSLDIVRPSHRGPIVNGWSSKYGAHYNGTNPVNSYTGTTHQLGTGTAYGEWLKLELPHKIKVTKFTLYPDDINKAPKSYKIYGSATGSSWTELKSVSGETPSRSGNSHEIEDTTGYKFVAIVVTQLNSDQPNVRIGELKIYGSKILEGGDTSVDTTFTSIMNTPQTTGANVYVDGKLGETFTNRVPGLLDSNISNTHTTYVSAGKYWELSGNVESNVTIEANTFLSGDAPHSVSVWFNSSNLMSNASNSCILSLGTEERLDHVSAAFSDNYQTVKKIIAGSRTTTNSNFGQSCAINSDGTRMIVGCPGEDRGASNYGAVYIYTYTNGKWDDGYRIGAPTPVSGTGDQGFGRDVDISNDGNRVVVGAWYDDSGGADRGAAYVYSYSNGTWTLDTVSGVSTGRIQSSDAQGSDRFGASVAMSGNGTKIVVGAVYEDTGASNAGAAYVFVYSGGSWGQEAKLQAHDASSGGDAELGWKVAMNNDGTKVVVGAPYHDLNASDGAATNAGAAYVFAYSGGSWSEQAKIQASDIAAGDLFGYCVDINSDGTKIVVGSEESDTGGSAAGAAYVYTYSGGSWGTEQKIQASDKQGSSEFGTSAAFNTDGTKLIVGARYEDETEVNSGAAYVFEYDGSSWNQLVKLKAYDTAASDHFGNSVAMSGDGKRIIVGMENDDDPPGTTTGSIYVYDKDTTHHLTPDLKLQSNTWHNLTYAYQGEGGSRVTYLDGREVAEDQVKDTYGDYPPFALKGYTQGGYVVSASEEYSSDYAAWEAFDDDTNTASGTGYWSTKAAAYSTSWGLDQHAYNRAGEGTLVEGTRYKGAWLQLEMPHRLKVDFIRWQSRVVVNGVATGTPYAGIVAGSNDGVKWYKIYDFDGISGPDVNDPGLPLIPSGSVSQIGYKYVRIITTKGGGNEYLAAQNVKIYGHKEGDIVRFPEPNRVLRYPHIELTDGPVKRGYKVTVSSEYSPRNQREGWMAFNDSISVPGGHWQNNESPNKYTGGTGVPTTDAAVFPPGGTQKGEWIKLELPHKIKVSSIFMITAPAHEAVKKAILYGSNDDTNWQVVKPEFTTTLTVSPGNKRQTTEPVTTSNYYKYLVLQVTEADSTGGGSNGRSIQIYRLQYFGVEENESLPIQIGGGNIDKVTNFRVYDKFVDEDQALEIWDAQKDEFERAKSSMTLQKGRLGLGTTEPEGRLAVLDEPHNLEEFPPRAIPSIGPITPENSKVYIDGHGIYEVLYSTDDPSHFNNATDNPLVLFDKNPNTGVYSQVNTYRLNSAGATGSSVGAANPLTDPAIYTGSNTHGTGDSHAPLKYKSLGGYGGIWYGLKFPYKVNLKEAHILPRGSTMTTTPNTAVFLGSEDGGVTWTKIGGFSGASWVAYKYNEYTLSHTNPINAVAIVITHSNHYYAPNLGELKFFGTREKGQSVLHDGQMTLTKNLTVPRIGSALDADNTPRRDRLILEYNTSTNPIVEGRIRDTSGRGFDGMFYGGGSYDSTERAFVFDGTDDYISGNAMGLKGSTLNKSYSLSTWVRMTNDNSAAVFFTIGTSANGKMIGFRMQNGSTAYLLYHYGGDYLTTPTTFGESQQWRHVAATYGGGFQRIYIDGRLAVEERADPSFLDMEDNPAINLGYRPGASSTEILKGYQSNPKIYDCTLTAEEVKTLYDMGRCDEGHHVVNFSKTRVGIGLADGVAPKGALEVQGDFYVNNNFVPGRYVGFSVYLKTSESAGDVTVWDGIYSRSQEFMDLPNTTGFYRIPYTGKYLFTFYGLFGGTSNMSLYKNSIASTSGGSFTKHVPYHDKGSGEGTWMQVVGSGVDDFAAGQFIYTICSGALYGQASSPHNGFSLTFLGA